MLEKGEISEICRKAVLEHFNLRKKSLSELKSKASNLEHNKQMIEREMELINKKIQEEKEIEQEKEQEKKLMQEKEEEKKEYVKENFFSWASDYGYKKEEIEKLWHKFVSSPKKVGIVKFLEGERNNG